MVGLFFPSQAQQFFGVQYDFSSDCWWAFLSRHTKIKVSSQATAWSKDYCIMSPQGSHIGNATCPGLNRLTSSAHYLLYLPSLHMYSLSATPSSL